MITVSTDKLKLDLPFIQDFLKDIYWVAGRTIEEVQTTINASFCFGIYCNDEQIGFARVVTDYIVFAYLMDVFITPAQRGNGYSSVLIAAMLDEPALQQGGWRRPMRISCTRNLGLRRWHIQRK